MNETSADGGEEAPAARPPAPEMKLSTAVKMGLGSTVTKLLEKRDAARSEALHEIDEGGHTVTHWAAKVGNIEIFRALLDAGAPFDVASSDKVAMFPLHWASTEGHLRVMRELVDRGADVDARDAQGCTALLIAAQYGQADAAAYLIKARALSRGEEADVTSLSFPSPHSDENARARRCFLFFFGRPARRRSARTSRSSTSTRTRRSTGRRTRATSTSSGCSTTSACRTRRPTRTGRRRSTSPRCAATSRRSSTSSTSSARRPRRSTRTARRRSSSRPRRATRPSSRRCARRCRSSRWAGRRGCASAARRAARSARSWAGASPRR